MIFSKQTCSGESAGFTLIEIVLALVVLGIVGTVGTMKYFDYQVTAEENFCLNSRAALLESLMNEQALEFAQTSKGWGKDSVVEKFNALLSTYGEGCSDATPCGNLCPLQKRKQGHHYRLERLVSVDSSGQNHWTFSVYCTAHDKRTGSTSPGNSGGGGGDSSSCGTLADTLADLVVDGSEVGQVLYNFFIDSTNGAWYRGNLLDSEAEGKFGNDGDYGRFSSATAAVTESLISKGIVTNNMIWRAEFLYDKNGGKVRGDSDPGEGTLYLWVANISDAQKKKAQNGSDVSVTAYEYTVRYKKDDETGKYYFSDAKQSSSTIATTVKSTVWSGNEYVILNVSK